MLGTKTTAVGASDYESVQTFDSWVKNVESCLKKALSTARGVNCIIRAVYDVLNAANKYVEDIYECGTEIPKSIQRIVDNCREIIDICENIIKISACSKGDDDSKTSPICFTKLFNTTCKLTWKLSETLILIRLLPSNTEACFSNATKQVEQSFDNFLPAVTQCVLEM
ncbi:uncharacterized protein LOC108605497 [Drosophila busckii]|uniref:uncharacterized protein LOC108605497 n=1 Tax=Drosophila busckii TaxID=30019 RepID=UPI00083EF4FD|nr:uncharacterized protein LOC108605497 [Drosophila busckii]